MDQLASLLNNLKDYFNDFVGAVIPGAVFLTGLALLFSRQLDLIQVNVFWGTWTWLPALAAMFVVGHLMLATYFWLRSGDYKPKFDEFAERPVVRTFAKYVHKSVACHGFDSDFLSFNELRSIAMSICPDAADVGRRFMFISLFCYGSGTALALLGVLVYFSSIEFLLPVVPAKILVSIALAFSAGILFARGREFEQRAYFVPFLVAIASIAFLEASPEADSTPPESL